MVRIVQGSEHFQEADTAVQEALHIAQRSQHPRAEALANVVLASLRDQQGRPNEVIAPAQAALAYYKQNGYFETAAKATLLLLRVEEGRGEFQQTLLTANQFLALAEQSGDSNLMMLAEQHIGTTYESAERYPEALQHIQRARDLASDETNRAFEAKDCAEVLIKLGRFGDAEGLLHPIDKFDFLTIGISEVRSREFLAQEQYARAAALTTGMLKTHPDMTAGDKQKLEFQRAVAEAHLHRTAQAVADLKQARAIGTDEKGPDHPEFVLQTIEVELWTGNAQQAREDAIKAEQYFASKTRLDSDLRASLLAVSASESLSDTAVYNQFSTKSFDIQSSLEHTWEPQAVLAYLSRPDLRTLTRMLPRSGTTNTSGR
jgi:tetratricopeptide (TPR) repeat protein